MSVRPEQPTDIDTIFQLTKTAFADHPIEPHTEHFIVNALRAAGALTVSLVAETGGAVVGHIAFSPVGISDGSPDWYALGPVSVLPAFQRQGIGRALIEEGLTRLKNLGAQGCVLVGEPDFYQRFGFAADPTLTVPGIPQEYILSQTFNGPPAKGIVTHHPAFTAEN
ncbi:MAG: N-acetyltransferase [Candidatus Omnitrophica bacterium]|nr:N-acetyltransferase [Candidatus Omnitrophota bacterium]MCB9722281.1 N-acetyltransferase [Candidatus Omnitrophota bacterium]